MNHSLIFLTVTLVYCVVVICLYIETLDLQYIVRRLRDNINST